ncbi:MAG: hypothetical protein K6G00_08170 [Treponema sp.]|nr:hypothetical protein [Treponema sp.]
MKQIKNPYCFRVGKVVVKNVYSDDGISLQERFEQFARTLLLLQTDIDKPSFKFYQKNGFTNLEKHVSMFKEICPLFKVGE